VTFVDPRDPSAFERAIRPNTKIIYGESLGNPDIAVFPIEEVAAIAKKHNIPLLIDNTLLTPYLFRPFEWGANIIVHSLWHTGDCQSPLYIEPLMAASCVGKLHFDHISRPLHPF
jgi:O-acetylhomoserine/O-acetylserine sulfhydrylase-like pyridoxal-dependent enzyme